MKTEIKLTAPAAGKVQAILCEDGQMVKENDVLVNLDLASEEKDATK
jgi:biotin carboxyl carrier protein